MGLREWQAALGGMVEAHASGRDPRAVLDTVDGLSDGEQRWLRGVADTPGFELSSYVPRWWRKRRVTRSARLTLAALGGDAEDTWDRYRRAVPCSTLFFLAEALDFLAFVARTAERAHVRAVAELERALLALQQAALEGELLEVDQTSEEQLERHPLAALVAFQAPAEAVLGALVTGAVMPAEQATPQWVLVAPKLPRRWRPATPQEAHAFQVCEPATERKTLETLPETAPEAVASLLAAAALRGVRRAAANPR
ncbi:hypothetical protein Hoch_1583 [Haliangium ochraceum DSM 14365]|uniref:Uncharacterized protein n=1 Tax=Haliangium ochraceum (strain DSM 14365 / JCM 11303 / SMP-2) TaxID=502025 RepID=D0LVZ9_HALO1|nr:hypothetical protein Hoch_1583 [Haliangium ochraceum DSM 14365]